MAFERARIDTTFRGEDAYRGVHGGGEDYGAGGKPFYIEDVADVAFEFERWAWLGVAVERGERVNVAVSVGAAVDEMGAVGGKVDGINAEWDLWTNGQPPSVELGDTRVPTDGDLCAGGITVCLGKRRCCLSIPNALQETVKVVWETES